MGNKARKLVSLVLVVGLFFQQAGLVQAAGALSLAGYLNLSGSSAISQDKFRPVQMRYFSYEPVSDNFKILLDKGDLKKLEDKNAKEEAQTLLNYFLVGVTLPDDAFWVNLRPDSQDQIIDPLLEKTEVGRIMLEADLQLKKDISRMTSPQTPEGKAYWDKLYKKAGELLGTENITIPTITRPWIVPGEIIVRESQNSAYVYKAGLKVMLEEDYLNNQKTEKPKNQKTEIYGFSDPRLKEINQYSTQLIKELIIPKLTKEINSSKRYASLRQVYYSLILCRWFKLRFAGKSGSYASLINTRNLTSLTSRKPWNKGEYFTQYQQSFAKGEYNLKEQVYTPTGQSARSYVSGGVNWTGINPENGVALKGYVSNTSGMMEISGSAANPLNIGLQPAVAGSPVKARVENKLKELKNNSGLPILTTLDNMPEGAHDNDNALWAQTLRALHFSEPVYRRVEKEGKTEERYTGQPAFTNADADAEIKQLTVYDVSAKELYSIRKGEDVRGFILNPHANIPPEAYFMHRGIFASKADIQKAFYDNKIRFDITIVPPAIWGVDFAKTVGHYHDPVEKPEIYQVVSGEVLWLLQKTDEKGNVVDFITVRAKAGDIAIMLPGYGHVSVNLSETEPLVMADWLTWQQSSYYGSFKEKKGAAYYVIKNNQGQPELIPNEAYLKTQGVLPQPQQMVSKDGMPAFGLKRGIPIYNLVKLGDQEFKQKVEFLNDPQTFSNILTPEATLDDANPKETIRVVSSPLDTYEARYQELLKMSKDYEVHHWNNSPGVITHGEDKEEFGLGQQGFNNVVRAIDSITEEISNNIAISQAANFIAKLISILEELTNLKVWVGAISTSYDHHGVGISYSDERFDCAEPVRVKAQEALNSAVVQKAIKLLRSAAASVVKNSAHNLFVGSYGNINKGIAEKIFSEADQLKISKWIETVGLPVKTIILSPQGWGFDPDSDHWLEGSIMIDLVFEGVDAALRIGEHSFRMFGSSGRNGEWPQETNFDDIVRILYYDTFTGYGSAERISAISDPSTRQNEIWQFKANFGELTEETIQYMTAINPDKLAKNNLDDTFSLIQTSAFLTSGQKNELLYLLNGLYGKASSYFQEEKAAKENPVYHHTQVLYNMTRIALGEKCEYSELKKLLVLALLHDIGNAICVNQKWTNDQIIAAFDEANKPENSTQKEELLRRAIEIAKKGMAFRLEHMEKGPELIEEITRGYGKLLTKDDIDSIKEAVRKHDYPSIEKNLDGLRKNGIVTDEQAGAFLLPFEDPAIGRLVEFLREADRLFMLSVQGVIKDIKDNNRKKRKEGGAEIAINLQSVSAQGKKNIKSHKEEYNLYKRAGKDDGKFRNNESLYRTNAGYAIFKDAEKRFNSSSSLMQFLPDKKTGGIDFRALPMTVQPMGSFRGLDFGLPRLSQSEIEGIDVESQIGQIKNMVSFGISPSGRRVKELVAACAQKGQISAYADDLLACIGDILKLEEEIAKESSPELKEALVLADLGGNYFQL